MYARRLGAALAAVASAVTAGAYAAPARSAEASAAQAQLVPATSRDVSFVVAGTTTYGTLAVPVHRPGQRQATQPEGGTRNRRRLRRR